MRVRNRRMVPEEFSRMREGVLGRWPTGRGILLEEAAEYLKSLPANKNMARTLADAKEKGYCTTCPRGGRPLLEDMVDLHQTLEREGDQHILLPVTTDSYTRSERFAEVERALEVCRREKRSVLNGYPTVNYGVGVTRRLTESTSRPLFGLGGNPTPCLTVEVSFASGITGWLGSGVCVPVAYSKHVSIEQCIRNYQYVDRLTGIYQEKGVPLYRETAGFLTSSLVPAGVKIAMIVLDSLLMAEQGVAYIGVGHGPQLNLLVDTASVLALEEMCREYLHRFGYRDVTLFTTLYSHVGAFPENVGMTYAITSMVGAIAGLAGVQAVNAKTVDEARNIPTFENIALASKAARQALSIVGKNRYPRTPELEFEVDMLRKEVRSIVDRVLELGDGDAAVGAVLAFDHGILDCPWSPNLCVKGKVMGARDHAGAVRYLNAGNVPIPREVLEYHQGELRKRAEAEKRPLSYEMLMDDLMAVASGRPLTVGRANGE